MDDLQRFEEYMAHLSAGLGHADRHAGLRGYAAGLMAPLQRKSVEPMAAHVDPMNVRSRHQSLHHFVADANWSDEQMLLRVCQWVVPQMDFDDGGWWIIDDTGFPKQGRHSVGVARQYCGMLGKQDNCQVAVSVSLACAAASLPVAWQLYLPQEWAEDKARRDKTGVPEAIEFATKPQIALSQIEHLIEQGAPRHCVLADAGYGVDTAFRDRLTALGLHYVVGVTGSITVWPPGREPLPPKPYTGRGRAAHTAAPRRQRRARAQAPDGQGVGHEHRPRRLVRGVLARRNECHAALALCSRAGACGATRSAAQTTLREPQWLLIEWHEGDDEPLKYWLSTLSEDIPLERMVYEAKMRWRIERDYQDLKQDLGLGQYEGRGWRGFHHHASLSTAAYGFLLAQRLRHPDEVDGKKNSAMPRTCPTHALQASGKPAGRSATSHRPSRACACVSALCWREACRGAPVAFGYREC